MSNFDSTLASFRGAEDALDKPTAEVVSAVTQATSNTTAVTLNAKHGVITMFGAVASATKAAFTVNCDNCLADSVVLLVAEGVTAVAALPIKVGLGTVAKGSFQVVVHNDDAANATAAAPIVHYYVLPSRL